MAELCVKPPGNPTTISSAASNVDGSRLYVASSNTMTVYKSTDFGASFDATHADAEKRAWSSIDTDDSGTKVIASAGQYVWTSGDYGGTWAQSLNMGNNARPIVTLDGSGQRAAAGDSIGVSVGTNPNAGLRTAECSSTATSPSSTTFTCEHWAALVPPPGTALNSKWTALDMTADGNRLAAGNGGMLAASNGAYTYTYGWPTAGAWNSATYVANAAGKSCFAVAFADNAAALVVARTVSTATNLWLGSGQGP